MFIDQKRLCGHGDDDSTLFECMLNCLNQCIDVMNIFLRDTGSNPISYNESVSEKTVQSLPIFESRGLSRKCNTIYNQTCHQRSGTMLLSAWCINSVLLHRIHPDSASGGIRLGGILTQVVYMKTNDVTNISTLNSCKIETEKNWLQFGDIFKLVLLNENCYDLFKFQLMLFRSAMHDIIISLFEIMTWHGPG